MYRHIMCGLLLATTLGISHIQAQEKTPDLTLQTLFKKVEATNPGLKSKNTAIKSVRAKRQQAGVLPNPEAELESENILGSGETQGFDSAETTLKLSKKIEWGGKRKARIDASELALQYASLEYKLAKQTLFLTAFERYIDVISQQQRVSIAKDQKNLHQQFVDTVSKQIKSGRLPAAELTRAEILLINSSLLIKSAKHEYEESLSWLSMLWNETGHIPPFKVEDLPVPSHNLVELQAHSDSVFTGNISHKILVNQRNQANQNIVVEKTLASQDPILSGGIRRSNGSDTTSFVAGIGIPLAIFDQNKGNIKAAQFKSEGWDHQLAEFENELMIVYEHTFHHAHLLQNEATVLTEKVLPKTKSVYQQIKQGYLQGKYAYLDVINAQKEWVEAQERTITVLGNYWKTIAKLEVILGHSLDHQLPELFAQTKETSDE